MVGLDDECQGNMDAGQLRAKCCLFLRVGFTIQYLDKFFLALHLSALLLWKIPPSIGWGGEQKRKKKHSCSYGVAYFSSPASPWEARWLFFFPGSLLIKKRWEARKDLEGLPDKASVHGNNHPGCMNCRYNGFTAMTEYWALKLFHCLRRANRRHFLGREWSSLTPWHCHARAASPVCTISLVAYRR